MALTHVVVLTVTLFALLCLPCVVAVILCADELFERAARRWHGRRARRALRRLDKHLDNDRPAPLPRLEAPRLTVTETPPVTPPDTPGPRADDEGPTVEGIIARAAATPGIPLPAGADTVAGKPCDKLRFEGGATGEAELCVTAEGVILAYRQKTEDGTEVSAVAIKLDYGRQDPRLFQVPKGFRVNRKR